MIGGWKIARCEPECGWSYGPSRDDGAINRACNEHEPDCYFGGPIIELCQGPRLENLIPETEEY